MPHTMVEPLKRLGLPIELNIGKVVLQEDFLVCSPGDCLNHEQTRILVRGTVLVLTEAYIMNVNTFRNCLRNHWRNLRSTCLSVGPMGK